MASDPNDAVANTRYGWWSELDIAYRNRVMIYYAKQTKEEKAAKAPKLEVRVTGVTSTKKGIGYGWDDKHYVGELEAEFVRTEDYVPPVPA